jgi:hypothetical protein
VLIQRTDENGSLITWPARVGATGLTLTPETSTDLLDWEPWGGELTKEWLADGRERVTTAFPTQDQRHYFRLKVTIP